MTQKPSAPSSSSSATSASPGGAASGGKGGQQSRPTPPPPAKPSTPPPAAPPVIAPAAASPSPAPTAKPVVAPQAAPTAPGASATPAPPPASPPAAPPRPAPNAGRGPLPVLVAIGFLLLLVGLAYVWQRQEQFMAQAPAVDPAAFAGLEGQVRALQPRLAQLEQRAAPDFKPLESRIAALENKPAPPAPPAPDVSGAIATAVAPLGQRMDALAKADQASQAALAAKVDAAVAKLDAAGNQEQDAARQLVARVDGLEKKLVEAEARATQQAAQAARALRAQQALTALESGKPLGDIANAPAAVAKFATTKPPTEAELRFAFPAAAGRAADASKPAGANMSIGERMLQHAESLVTVRQGDKVVVGTTAAQTLGVAKEKLDAGDLAGAMTALDGLDPSAAQAMAPWRAQAQSLLDARAALTAMTVSAAR